MDSWRELQKNSYISWVAKYESEKKKRIEAEEKYNQLVERIKTIALENYYKDLIDEDWDEERMDIIGQNGNTGDHYQYELWNYASEEREKNKELEKVKKEAEQYKNLSEYYKKFIDNSNEKK